MKILQFRLFGLVIDGLGQKKYSKVMDKNRASMRRNYYFEKVFFIATKQIHVF
jgi:hypothetical protein